MDASNETTNLILAFFYKHPLLGSIVSLCLATMGELTHHILIEIQIPVLIMQCIQIFIWSLAGVASVLTIRSIIKKK